MSVKEATEILMMCPLCREDNPAMDTQRCQHCGMLMMSDKEYTEIIDVVKPLIQEVESIYELEKKPQRWLQIQPILKKLEPYTTSFPFVKQFGQRIYKGLKEDRDYLKFLQMYRLNIFILLILMLMPLGALFLGGGPELWGLLLLPVLGWAWFGIFLFKKNWQKKERG